ncbi:hypothetical protein HanPI659440_Chr15g0587821 [Helianthus annuus]|nr:hypothetical protein HanPI659440_Chr15g0587821 [Helianthus annuus]
MTKLLGSIVVKGAQDTLGASPAQRSHTALRPSRPSGQILQLSV